MKYPVRIRVGGEVFDVFQERHRGGVTTQFRWISGPDPAYGFSVSRSDGEAMTEQELERTAANFLKNVDPATGYLPD